MKSIQSDKELYEQRLYWYFLNSNKSSFLKQWLNKNTGIGKLRRIETTPQFVIFLIFLSAKKQNVVQNLSGFKFRQEMFVHTLQQRNYCSSKSLFDQLIICNERYVTYHILPEIKHLKHLYRLEITWLLPVKLHLLDYSSFLIS